MSRYVLVVNESTEGERGGVWTQVSLHATEEEAKSALNKVLRGIWMSEIETGDGETKRLADCPGWMNPSDGSPKWSDEYYAEDGTAAWECTPDGTSIHKAEILELREGETCVSTRL